MARIAVFVAVTAEIKRASLPTALKNHQIEIFYTGMGKVRSALVAAEILATKKWDLVVNLGTAGSHRFPVGSLVECRNFVERDVNLADFGVEPGRFPGPHTELSEQTQRCADLPSAVCGSGDRIDISPPVVVCDVYDMEAFSIASVCQRWALPFLCLKYVSDTSTDEVFAQWKASLAKAEVSLVRRFRSFLETLDETHLKSGTN